MELGAAEKKFLEFLLHDALSAADHTDAVSSMPPADLEPQEENTFQCTVPAMYAEWNAFNRHLFRMIAVRRADKLGFDDTPYHEREDSSYQIDESVKKIIAAESPLEAEKEIIRMQWEFLEEQETLHAFDFVQLAIYGIKLLLLERHALFTAEKGREEFEEIFSNVQSRIKQIN